MNPVHFLSTWFLSFFESPVPDMLKAGSVLFGVIVTFSIVVIVSLIITKCYCFLTGKNIND